MEMSVWLQSVPVVRRHSLHPIFRHYNYENDTITQPNSRGVDCWVRQTARHQVRLQAQDTLVV